MGNIQDDGTHIVKSAEADNTEVTVHTVAAEKTLYLSAVICSIHNYSGGPMISRYTVTDSGDTIKYTFASFRTADDDSHAVSCNFIPPLEIPAGYKLKARCLAGNARANFFIYGYEV